MEISPKVCSRNREKLLVHPKIKVGRKTKWNNLTNEY
jgi:hypothetical protein